MSSNENFMSLEPKVETGLEEYRPVIETAFGRAYEDETEKIERWEKESEKNLEQAKEMFLERLKGTKGKFIGVLEKGGTPLYLKKAGKKNELPACGSAYRSFAEYTKEDIQQELLNGAKPIFDDDIIQQGEINSGIEYWGGYYYDFSGEVLALTNERGGYEDLKEECDVFDMPILMNDLSKFLNFARRMVGKMKKSRRKGYEVPENLLK